MQALYDVFLLNNILLTYFNISNNLINYIDEFPISYAK